MALLTFKSSALTTNKNANHYTMTLKVCFISGQVNVDVVQINHIHKETQGFNKTLYIHNE
jgi:hypothetical protein